MDILQSFDRAVHSAMKRGLGNIDKALFYQIHQRLMRVRGLTIPQLNTIFTTTVYERKDMNLNTYHKIITEYFRLFVGNMNRVIDVEPLTKQNLQTNNRIPAHTNPAPSKFQPSTEKSVLDDSSMHTQKREVQKTAHFTESESGTTTYSFGISRKDEVFHFGRDSKSASGESKINATQNNGELLFTCPSDLDQYLAQRRLLKQRGCNSEPLVVPQNTEKTVCADTGRSENLSKSKPKKSKQPGNSKSDTTVVASSKDEHVRIVDADNGAVIGMHGSIVAGSISANNITIVRKRNNPGSVSSSGSSQTPEANPTQGRSRLTKPVRKKKAYRDDSLETSEADRQFAKEAMARATVRGAGWKYQSKCSP